MFYERAPETMAALLATLLQGYMSCLCLNDKYKVLFGIETPAQIDFGKAAAQITEDFLRIYAS